MENLFCKNSSGENQNETKSLSVQNEDLYDSEALEFPKGTFPASEKNSDINIAEETDQGMNDNNAPKTLSDCDSPKVSDSVMQKSISPTLIGSAIKVMKNFFSPDKTKSKSASVLSTINHPRSNSGSPRSSIFIPGKTELFSSRPETEIHKSLHSASEENLKNTFPINELGQIQSPFTLDHFNNTDDSFLTSVSLIDESFHSAVTHLDEHGDTLKNGITLMENVINNSQNLDLVESYNDSFENNETCLENTTLKNSTFTSEGTKLTNASTQSLENLSSIQFGDGCHYPDDSGKVSLTETQGEIIKQNMDDSILKVKYSTSGYSEVLVSNNLHSKHPQEADFQENMNLPVKINSEITTETKDAEMAHLFLRESFQILSSSKFGEGCDGSFNPNMIEEEKENDLLKSLRVKKSGTDFKGSCENQDAFVDNSISTTTVVLSTVDSADLDNMLVCLKADESGTNTSSLTSLEGDDNTLSLENGTENLLLKKLGQTLNTKQSSEKCFSSEKNFLPLSCMSEGNSPNNKTECPKIKLNRSDEFLSHSLSNESTDRKWTLKQKKSSVDFSLMKINKLEETSKELPSDENTKVIEVIKDSEKHNLSEIDKSEIELCYYKPESVSVVSQQSYTIFSINDNSLTRPVIEPLNVSGGIEKQTFQINESDVTHSSKNAKRDKWFINNCNGSFGTENLINSRQPKQSTPLLEENCESLQRTLVSSSSELFSMKLKESVCDKEVDVLGKTTQIFYADEASPLLSPVGCNNEDKLPLSVLVGNGTEESLRDTDKSKVLLMVDSEEQNLSQKLEEKSECFDETLPIIHNTNQTFDMKLFSRMSSKLSQTSEKSSSSPGCNTENCSFKSQLDLTETKLNLTYDKNPVSNETFTKKTMSETDVTNKTFIINFGENQLNQVVDKKFENLEQPKLNETFINAPELSFPNDALQVVSTILDVSAFGKSNDIIVKETDFGNTCIEKKTKEISGSFENKEITESIVLSQKSELSTYSGNNVSKENKTFPKSSSESFSCKVDFISELNSKDFNESSVSTKSSDTSLVCSDLSTVLNNEEELPVNLSTEELSRKLGKINLSENSKQVAEEQFDECSVISKNDPNLNFVAEQNQQEEEKLMNSFREETLSCDVDLVQLIQEQFSPKDIERICSVVHDLSSIKLSSDILRASEEFDKSFYGNLPSVELKPPENEMTLNQPLSTLSPQSLDFLNSIRGKPTGRDLSRESLYVKFDPLVQPSANSLIDFTKEAEAIAAVDTSTVSPHSSSICEKLLTISPQKKTDDIVPPLTPLSHKVKSELSDDKLEKLKELQNEIYFLKNLYAERERTNKTKMEDYESQIAELTGVSCMLDNKLKESNEREKCLVKKLREHTQSIGQLKVIMEEYAKVISKLSAELETIKSEKFKQIETLSVEKDSYVTHLQNTEAAFTDVHAKYEKSKKTIVSLKANEIMYRNTIAEQAQKLEDFKIKAKEAQEKALFEFKKIEAELHETKASHTQETARLRAQLRKTELKVEALQEALDQKVKENQQLTAICDELIEGKK